MPTPNRRLKGNTKPRSARDGLTIRRKRCGNGFSYHAKNGRRISDAGIIKRLARLAVPPAYNDVVYAADPLAPLQAMGRDAAGRWQYRYHPEREKQREQRKTRHIVRLIGALPRIRRRVTMALSSRKPTREFAMAAAVALVEATGIRSGSARHARLSGARGAVTLLKSNVRIAGRSIRLEFKAKGGKHVVKDVRAPRLVPVIKVLQRLPGRRLFSYEDAGEVRTLRVREVNAFLCDVASCKLSLKDFRTLRASMRVAKTLARAERGTNERARKRQMKEAIQAAADDLANTVAICRKSYVHEAIVDAFEKGTLGDHSKGANGKPVPAQQILADVVGAHADDAAG